MKKKYTKRQITEAIAYWKRQLKLGNYKKLNESNENYVIGLWDKDGNGGPKNGKEFSKLVCSYCYKGCTPHSYYEDFVPNDTTEMSIQTDVDDFDEYQVNFQDMLSEEDFWEKLLEAAQEDPEIYDGIDSKDFLSILDKHAQEIADYAFENYNPNSSQMTWKGGYSRGGRYPDA